MKKIIPIVCLLATLAVYANNGDCESNLKKARDVLNTRTPFTDINSLKEMVARCASEGVAEAEHLMGMFYIKGVGETIDEEVAFSYFKSAANKGYDKSQYNLGRMYLHGQGCNINLDSAVYWYEEAANQGNQRALFFLGYMSYTGYGVKQDYTQAIAWFEQSSWPMAIHYMGMCHLQGYGVPADEGKAMEYLMGNNISNSQNIVKLIEANREAELASQLHEGLTVQATNESEAMVEPAAIEETTALDLSNLEKVCLLYTSPSPRDA